VGRRVRPLGAVELAGPVAGDERTARRDVEVGAGAGRGGAGRDRAGTAAADVQAGGTEVIDLRQTARAGSGAVDLARERRAAGGGKAAPPQGVGPAAGGELSESPRGPGGVGVLRGRGGGEADESGLGENEV